MGHQQSQLFTFLLSLLSYFYLAQVYIFEGLFINTLILSYFEGNYVQAIHWFFVWVDEVALPSPCVMHVIS